MIDGPTLHVEFFVDRIDVGDNYTLDDVVFQRGNAQRTLSPVRLRDEPSPIRLRR